MEIKEFGKLHAEALKVNPSAGLLADLFVQWDDLVEGIRPYVSHSAPISIVTEDKPRKGASDEHKGVSVSG